MKPGYDIEDAVCVLESKSGKALLIAAPFFAELGEENGKKMIPKSQITDDSEVYKVGDEGTLIVTEWLAEKEGWL
jgi:hypothetical protein